MNIKQTMGITLLALVLASCSVVPETGTKKETEQPGGTPTNPPVSTTYKVSYELVSTYSGYRVTGEWFDFNYARLYDYENYWLGAIGFSVTIPRTGTLTLETFTVPKDYSFEKIIGYNYIEAFSVDDFPMTFTINICIDGKVYKSVTSTERIDNSGHSTYGAKIEVTLPYPGSTF